jgi:hypothetical protein
MKSRIKVFLALSAACICTSGFSAVGEPLNRIARTIPLGAPERWDYLTWDAAMGRVYVAHGDRITGVDAKAGAVIGTAPGFTGARAESVSRL